MTNETGTANNEVDSEVKHEISGADLGDPRPDAETTETTEVEASRQRGIECFNGSCERGVVAIDKHIDEIIKELQQNKGHIGGLIVLAVPTTGTQLVDSANDSVWALHRICTSSPHAVAMLKTMANEAGDVLSMRPKREGGAGAGDGGRRDPLADLIAQLSGRK